MTETYMVGSYWGNRKESAEECADRLRRLLIALAGIDEVFARWFRPGRSRKEALSREVRLEADDLRTLVDRSRHYTDVGQNLMEDRGFSVSPWNGEAADDSAALRISCGGCACTAVTWIPNSCLLYLPTRGPAAARVTRLDTLAAILGRIIDVLERDWAMLNCVR